ncbi:Domain of unknown function (DUF1995) [Seminavis robusta]|uniref:DUF1995 domain-containing protein n=1 Tax=Seminavis robusta TaxID=568900 RepID=A0A9N8DTL0_9STRA|nr:Domain of unknown function (DUF1995) [Seminavis robusta]|eukprot:Sro333_g119610.1 Domain of unknown function (DUF1995) (279) ;mRNA; f:52748-53584
MMQTVAKRSLALASIWAIACVSALVPQSPVEQTRLAVRSLKKAIDDCNEQGKAKRFYVDYLIPLPPETQAEDIDPWPGGLAQMYPYAETILKEVLGGIVGDEAGSCSSQVISQSDCCGFFVQESTVSPKNDIGAILFPGVDQLDKMQEIDAMVGKDRTLILFNRQFQRPVDFGFVGKGRAQTEIFDKYSWGFAFQEIACRGEDVKLTFEYPLWESCVICDEDLELGPQQVDLLAASKERPVYEDLKKEINIKLPEPLWMRKMGEVERKGFKFQRGDNQ